MQRNWRRILRSGCRGTTTRRWSGPEYDASCLAKKDRLRPCESDTSKWSKWPPNGHLKRQNQPRAFGQHYEPWKMFRVGSSQAASSSAAAEHFIPRFPRVEAVRAMAVSRKAHATIKSKC